jgi:voltage-gated potassium channel
MEALSILGWALSPTRKIIDLLKRGDPNHRARTLLAWNLWFFRFEVMSSVMLVVATEWLPSSEFRARIWVIPLAWFVILIALSRCNEITYAFYRDVINRLEDDEQGSALTPTDRIKMTFRSYLGLALNFAMIYFFLPLSDLIGDAKIFNTNIERYFDCVYFSGITITTLGYGDIIPIHWISRLTALYEVFSGILLIVVAIAVYVSLATDAKRR